MVLGMTDTMLRLLDDFEVLIPDRELASPAPCDDCGDGYPWKVTESRRLFIRARKKQNCIDE
jgi:hypothetical protein